MKRSQKSVLTFSLLLVSLSLTACGRRAPGVTPDVPVAQPSAIANPLPPVDNAPVATPPIPQPGDPYGTVPSLPAQPPNPPLAQLTVDQDSLLNQWQARGIAVSGGNIYIAAVDTRGILKKGTVIKMDATSGKNWKNLGSSFMGLSHKLDETLQSVTIAGGNLFALDASKGLFSVSTNGGQIKELRGTGGYDLAGTNQAIFVATNGMLERSDMSGTSRAPLPGIMASNGIGANSRGEILFISGNRIAMLDLMGRPRDVVTQGLVNPIDVAGDARNGDIYVLEQSGIKRFSATGQLLSSFAHNAVQPSSIAVDESGNVYVSDFGNSHKDSRIFKFGPVAGMNTGYGMGYNAGYDTGYGVNPGYGTNYGPGYGIIPNYGYGTGYDVGYGTNPSYGNYTGYNTSYNSYAAPQNVGSGYIPAPTQPHTTQGRRY